jgi:hypothetical protein
MLTRSRLIGFASRRRSNCYRCPRSAVLPMSRVLPSLKGNSTKLAA